MSKYTFYLVFSSPFVSGMIELSIAKKESLMITVYTTDTCAYCPLVKKFLQMKNVEYDEVNVTNDHNTRGKLFSETGLMTVPVTKNGSAFVVGFNPAELAKLIS